MYTYNIILGGSHMNFSFIALTEATGLMGSTMFSFVSIGVMLVLLYFIMIRPQRKKEKQATNMRNSIEVGDGITTIGGLVGRVASIKDDVFVLETGSDRIKIRMKKWAIQEVEKLNMDTTADKKEPEVKEAKK